MLSEVGLRKAVPTYSAFEHLWRSVCPLREDQLFGMFTVHLDESSKDESFAYTVAGYVATVEQWAELEREWIELCDDVHVRYIHKADLENQWGEFRYLRDLEIPEADEVMYEVNRRCPDIILRAVSAGFVASVYKTDWLECDKGRFGKTLGESFYAGGVFACFKLVSTWMNSLNLNEPIRYVLEKGAKGRHEVEALLRRTDDSDVATALAHMAGWGFEEGKKVRIINGVEFPPIVPLQAADFLAYEIFRQMDNRVVEGIKRKRNGDEIPTRYPLKRLLQQDKPECANLRHYQLPIPYFVLNLNKAKIAELITDLDRIFPT